MSTMERTGSETSHAGGEAQASTTGDLRDPGHDAHEAGHHVTSLLLLTVVFVALLVLTWVTVAVTWINLGPANVWIALGIAAVKAALVVLYFMHLRWDSPFNSVVFITALIFVVILIGATIQDSLEYRDVLASPAEPPEIGGE